MSDLLNEFISSILSEASFPAVNMSGGKAPRVVHFKSAEAKASAISKGTHREYNPKTDKNLPTHAGDKSSKDTPKTSSRDKPTAAKPSTPASSSQLSSSVANIPGSTGIMDAIVGVTEKGSAGAGTPESRAAEASVVIVSNALLQERNQFRGDIDSFLRQNDEYIDSIINHLMSLKGSKLKEDWRKAVKSQIIATLSRTERKFGKIESLVWDNAEGRASIGLATVKDLNDRSDLYIKTKSGEIVGVSLKKSGQIFLANQGFAKIIRVISEFATNAVTRAKIMKLARLHRDAADGAYKRFFDFIKSNPDDVKRALASVNRNSIKSLSSEKYDQYFNPDGTLVPRFISKVISGEKLSTGDKAPEFKTLMKCLDAAKKEHPSIKSAMGTLRKVDLDATKKLLQTIEKDEEVKRAVTKYLLDSLDIPQTLLGNPSAGLDHVVTVYGEGSVDEAGNTVPMYVDAKMLAETLGISSSSSASKIESELSSRFIIDAESDGRVGMIRLRMTNKTPPPAYYYPTVATLALRARGLGSAAAFELYQHDSWTHTLASRSPDPRDWNPQQRKKQAQSTITFLERQLRDADASTKNQILKDIEFYRGLL